MGKKQQERSRSVFGSLGQPFLDEKMSVAPVSIVRPIRDTPIAPGIDLAGPDAASGAKSLGAGCLDLNM